MGSYYGTLGKHAFIKSKTPTRAGSATPHLLALKDAWFAAVTETDEGEEIDESTVKLLSGGCDSLAIRPLYRDEIVIKPRAKVVLLTNNEPRMNVIDVAMLDRLRCVPFMARFSKNPTGNEIKANQNLVDSLLNDHIDAIFEWILAGTQEWYQDKVIIPSQVASAYRSKYINENDTLQRFIDECMTKEKGNKINQREFIDLYEEWCMENGIKAYKRSTVVKQLPKKKFIVRKSHGLNYVFNIKINYVSS